MDSGAFTTLAITTRALGRTWYRPASVGPEIVRVNGSVYDLCRRYPRHVDDAEIIAKVWLIGRTYAASLERGKGDIVGLDVSNDRFYIDHVTRVLRASTLDQTITQLEQVTEVEDPESIQLVLRAHAELVKLFFELTGKKKRSLASKYLHFHLPSLFFIYDSRAMAAIRMLRLPRQRVSPPPGADGEYATFLGAALGARRHLTGAFGQILTPRQLDRLLLSTFASRGM
jgi:hypothetical protein